MNSNIGRMLLPTNTRVRIFGFLARSQEFESNHDVCRRALLNKLMANAITFNLIKNNESAYLLIYTSRNMSD